MAEKIYIFKGFERFWHWSQAGLIVTLMATGFEVHGLYEWFGFGRAVDIHTTAAWLLVGLWVFALFWHLTTGEWKQYIPTLEKVDAMIKYYLTGIFKNAEHPFRQTRSRKHNPLQRIAYLFVLAVINPLIWASGWAYLFYDVWIGTGFPLQWVALAHTIGAFLMLIFFIIHVYLATAGHTWNSHIKAMITGWEEVH